jgi:hypothetical protein
MSKVGDTAAGVVARLTGSGYPEARLDYAPWLAMSDGTEYSLTVTPIAYAAAEERNRVSRRVKVGITMIAAVKTTEEFGAYNDKVEAIVELFYLKALPNLAGVNCDGFEVNPMGSDLRFREVGQYLAHIELEFITI